jgi:hypothetical protein
MTLFEIVDLHSNISELFHPITSRKFVLIVTVLQKHWLICETVLVLWIVPASSCLACVITDLRFRKICNIRQFHAFSRVQMDQSMKRRQLIDS